ncbi:MAG: hypothetical protein ACTSW4_06155 [Candidatus Ranarchaeia archaeon]
MDKKEAIIIVTHSQPVKADWAKWGFDQDEQYKKARVIVRINDLQPEPHPCLEKIDDVLKCEPQWVIIWLNSVELYENAKEKNTAVLEDVKQIVQKLKNYNWVGVTSHEFMLEDIKGKIESDARVEVDIKGHGFNQTEWEELVRLDEEKKLKMVETEEPIRLDHSAPFESFKQFFFLSSEIEIDKAYITHKLLSPFLAIHIDLQKLKDRDFSYEFWNELKEAYQGKLGGLCKYVKSMKEYLKTKMKDYNWKPIDDLFSDDRLEPVTTVVGALNEGDVEQLGNNFEDIGELIKKFCDWITDLQEKIDSLDDTKKEAGS